MTAESAAEVFAVSDYSIVPAWLSSLGISYFTSQEI